MKCFHHTDLDGYCSGAIVKSIYPDCEMYEIDYDIPFQMDFIQEGEVVFLVDFGFNDVEVLRELNKRAKLIWIDHHKDQIEKAQAAGLKIRGSQVIDSLSGCEQTWDYLYGDMSMPRAVFLLGRWDVWDHEADSDTWPFQYGMQAMSTLPRDNMDLWLNLFAEEDDFFIEDENSIESIIQRGRVIQQWVDKHNIQFAMSNAFTLQFEGHTWVAVNSPEGGSSQVDAAFKPDEHQGKLVFGYKGRSKRWKISFYGDPGSGLDCAAIAQKYGGGGHFSSAGCTVEHLPFKIPISMREEVNR